MNTRVLFASDSLTVADVWCEPGVVSDSGLEVEGAFGLSLPRTGVYVHRTPEGPIVAEPTVAILHSQGDEHVTVHPNNHGDRNTDVQFSPEVIEEFLGRSDRFAVRTVPIDDTLGARHRRLRAIVEAGLWSALEVEELALELLGRIVGATPFPETSSRHRVLVDHTRQVLAERFMENLDLRTIAREVGSSPHHLSRVFKQSTGRALSDYRTALRVAFAMDRIADRETDLSRVATEAGFFDHSHMTNTFRRRLGSAPSVLRSVF